MKIDERRKAQDIVNKYGRIMKNLKGHSDVLLQ